MTPYNITSRHSTLAAAVAESGLDFSYNERLAAEAIKDADAPCRRAKELGIGATEKAYIAFRGGEKVIIKVYSVEGIRFAREFSPFCGALSDSPFLAVQMSDLEGKIVFTGASLPKNPAGRKAAAMMSAACPEIAFM